MHKGARNSVAELVGKLSVRAIYDLAPLAVSNPLRLLLQNFKRPHIRHLQNRNSARSCQKRVSTAVCNRLCRK